MIELKDGALIYSMVKTSASSMSKLIDDLILFKNVENNEGKLDVQILAEVDSVLKLIRIDNK
jgi:hypothetical protein